MRKILFVALVAAAAALVGCGSDDKDDKNEQTKCEDRALAFSCDMSALSQCVAYSKGVVTQDKLEEACMAGSFAAAPCDTGDDFIGSCDFGCVENTNRQVIHYYADLMGGVDTAMQACEIAGGTWTAGN